MPNQKKKAPKNHILYIGFNPTAPDCDCSFDKDIIVDSWDYIVEIHIPEGHKSRKIPQLNIAEFGSDLDGVVF